MVAEDPLPTTSGSMSVEGFRTLLDFQAQDVSSVSCEGQFDARSSESSSTQDCEG